MLTSGRLVDFDRNIAPLVAAGLISAAGSVAGAGINSASQSIANKKSWKYTQRAMKLQQQYALEQMQKQYELNMQANKEYFDYQNAYNEPSKVFERYMKAGINPAAVLGSSGVGVNATMSGTPSSTTGTPSGPSADFDWKPVDASMLGSGAASAGSLMLEGRRTESEVQRNEAAADRDNAEAGKLRGDTHSQEYRKAADELDLLIKDKEKRSMDDRHAIDVAQSRILRNNAELSDWTLGGSIDAVIASQQMTIEEAKRSRMLTPAYSAILNGQIALQTAQAYYYGSNGSYFSELADLTALEVQQLAKEIDNNWTKRYEITLPDGRKERWSMQDFMNVTQQNRTTASFYEPEEARGKAQQSVEWKRREIFNALVGILGQGIIARGLRGRGQVGTTTTDMGNTYENVRRYNAKGEYIGGTRVTRGQVTPGKTYTEKY